jgi:AdoMet-dependent heme synthase
MVVLWRITELCNLGCVFCGYSRELLRERREADAREIRRFSSLLGEFQENTGEGVLLSWLGGEPLLRADLTELTRHAVLGCGLRVSTTTNGSALASAPLRSHLIECYAELTLSVDGLGGLHDAVRGWPGGYARIRRAIGALLAERAERGRGPLIRVNTVLMHDNVRGYPALARELASLGVDELTFNQLGGVDRPEFFARARLSSEDAGWLSERLPELRLELAGQGARLLGGPEYADRIRATAAGTRLPVADCAPGGSFLFIDEQGLIGPCSFTIAQYGVPLAEIDGVSALRSLPERFAAARSARRARSCGDCHSTQIFAKFSRVSA